MSFFLLCSISPKKGSRLVMVRVVLGSDYLMCKSICRPLIHCTWELMMCSPKLGTCIMKMTVQSRRTVGEFRNLTLFICYYLRFEANTELPLILPGSQISVGFMKSDYIWTTFSRGLDYLMKVHQILVKISQTDSCREAFEIGFIYQPPFGLLVDWLWYFVFHMINYVAVSYLFIYTYKW